MDKWERMQERQQKLDRQRRSATRKSSMIFIVMALAFCFYRMYGPAADGTGYSKPEVSGIGGMASMSPEAKDDFYITLRGQWNFMLVNSDNPLPENFAPELAEIKPGELVDSRMEEATRLMLEAAQKEEVVLEICSAYRSVEIQKRLYQQDVEKWMSNGLSREDSIQKTEESLQKPNYSEHHTGLAIDIITPSYRQVEVGFENTDAFRWLEKNAQNYGFILRYPKDKASITGITYEPWHYRYVGVEAAKMITEQKICLEEFLGEMQIV